MESRKVGFDNKYQGSFTKYHCEDHKDREATHYVDSWLKGGLVRKLCPACVNSMIKSIPGVTEVLNIRLIN